MPSTLRKVLFFDRFRRVEGIFRFLKSRKKTFFCPKTRLNFKNNVILQSRLSEIHFGGDKHIEKTLD